MILQFSVSNFRCFRRQVTLNLAASGQDKSLPENCIAKDLPGLTGKRWLKGAALYGANASGKTTVLEALRALSMMVQTSAGVTDPKEPIPQIEPFVLCPVQGELPTAFAVVFVADDIRYEYRVAATGNRIWHESLRAFPNKVEQLWYSRDWDLRAGSYQWTPERPTGFQRDSQLEGYTLGNVLFLSKAVANNRSELEPVFRWFKDGLRFLDLRRRLGTQFTLRAIQEQTPLRDRVLDFLRHADLGVTDARVIENRPPDEVVEKMFAGMPQNLRERFQKEHWQKPELYHLGSGGVHHALPWDSESAGTQQIFGLAARWLNVVANGSTVCVDELETSMHPLMVRELLRVFFSEKENSKGAQILFTTHNPLLLDATLLRRDQVWFTDKDDEGDGHLYPLSDFNPRKGESLVRGYLSGRYGAVPFVPSGLLGTFEPCETLDKAAKESGG